MGKTKIKAVDDSAPEEAKLTKGRSSSGRKKVDSLVESLRSELGVVETTPEPQNVSASEQPEKKEAKPKKTETQKPRSKKYQEKSELVDRSQAYQLAEAIELAKSASFSKFPGTMEAHINLKQKNIRFLTSLPFAAGKKLTILAFGDNAKESGADLVGTDETIEEIVKGKVGFDVVVTTPKWMSKLAKAAKVLGPRGLMPNPKSGTITDNLKKVVEELQAGKVEVKTEPNGAVVHLAVGKVDQDQAEILANLKALFNSLGKSKVSKITLSSTMGIGVKVDLNSV